MIQAPRVISFFSEKEFEDYLNGNTFTGLTLYVLDHGGFPTLCATGGTLP